MLAERGGDAEKAHCLSKAQGSTLYHDSMMVRYVSMSMADRG